MKNRLPLTVILLFPLWMSCTLSCLSCCDDIVCSGGIEIGIDTASGSRLPAGMYELLFQIEDMDMEFACPVNDESMNRVNCEKSGTEIPDNFIHFCSTYNVSSAETDPDEYCGFICTFYFRGEDGSVRGPRTVELTVRYNGEIVNETSLTPEYNRDEDFWGNTCDGYCENLVGETVYLEL